MDVQEGKRGNRRLRLALWKCWSAAVQQCVASFGHKAHLLDLRKRCEEVEEQLHVEADEAAEKNGQNSGDD